MVTITFTEHALPEKSKPTPLSIESQASAESREAQDEAVKDGAATSALVASSEPEFGPAAGAKIDEAPTRAQVDEFLVVACLGGGGVQAMAVDPKNQAMKFIPWGGVAAHLKRNGVSAARARRKQIESDTAMVLSGAVKARDLQAARERGGGGAAPPDKHGKGFCFLPLPVSTGMPVHVNGYFELSSNRRDVWFGQDMAGEGKRRSEWNGALLADAVAPAYARLLACAARLADGGRTFGGSGASGNSGMTAN